MWHFLKNNMVWFCKYQYLKIHQHFLIFFFFFLLFCLLHRLKVYGENGWALYLRLVRFVELDMKSIHMERQTFLMLLGIYQNPTFSLAEQYL